MTTRFTDAQRAVIAHGTGNGVVLAVAGSGKTTAMTHRADRLIRDGEVTGSNRILMLTFTRKAAESMKKRLGRINPGNQVDARTFHSFCLRVLREFDDRFAQDGAILAQRDEWKKTMWAEAVIKDLRLSQDTLPSDIIRIVESCKVRGVHPSHIFDDDVISGQLSEHEKTVYAMYDKKQHEKGTVFDPNDMLVYCFDLVRREERVRSILRKAYQHVMIDEYQDTDPCQEMILEIMGGCPNPTLLGEIDVPSISPTVMVVGDDDQSIYQFRHTVPDYIINFAEKWEAATYTMEENFRSQGQILDVANLLIGVNKKRVQKRLKTMVGENGEVVVLATTDDSRAVLDEVQRLRLEESVPWGSIAVLYRTNAQSCMFESRFTEADVPYVCHGSREGFYGMPEVKCLVSYLRLLVDPENFDALRYVWNKPNRYLKNDLLMKAKIASESPACEDILRVAADLAGRSHWKVERLLSIIQEGRKRQGQEPFAVLEWLLEAIDYPAWIQQVSEKTSKSISDLEQLADRVLEDAYGRESIPAFLEHVQKVIDNSKKQEKGDAVQLMTLHRSKGLEFDVVFFAGMTADYLPHPRTIDIEEERRLTYVGCTRAERRLYCCTNPDLPSPFLAEMRLTIPAHQESIPALRDSTDGEITEDFIDLEGETHAAEHGRDAIDNAGGGAPAQV